MPCPLPRYGEKMQRMLRSEEATFEELYSYACPKFITAGMPAFDNPNANTNMEAYRSQLRAFMGVVLEQKLLPALKQFLKLYSVSASPGHFAWHPEDELGLRMLCPSDEIAVKPTITTML